MLLMPNAAHSRRYGALTRNGVRSANSRAMLGNLRGLVEWVSRCHAVRVPRRPGRAASAAVIAVVLVCALSAPAYAKAKDTDGDGMPDRWEKAHNLNWRKPNAKADNDKDGISNIREFQLGLDPHKADGKCTELQLALGATQDECGQASVPLYLS